MDLAPPKRGRVANSSLGLLPAASSILYGAQANAVYPRLAAGLALLASAVIAVRGYRLGAVCRNSELIVRGYLFTRAIPRAGIIEITDFPAVRWTDASGRPRWSPLWFLNVGPHEIPEMRASKSRDIARLRRWVLPRNRRRTSSR